MPTKGCSEFFLFCLDHDLLIKLVLVNFQKPRLFFIFADNPRSKQNKINPELPFVDIGK